MAGYNLPVHTTCGLFDSVGLRLLLGFSTEAELSDDTPYLGLKYGQ